MARGQAGIGVAATLSAALVAASAAAEDAGDFSFPSLEGGEIDLGELEGGPVLVVNTASRCGFASQYEGLQALYERYRTAGLTVLGVPSNSFRQELETESAVKEFCEVNFAIDFPMTEITEVTGAAAHPFYAWAAAQAAGPSWNFHKILIGRDGAIAGAFGSSIGPSAPQLVEAIEAELAAR